MSQAAMPMSNIGPASQGVYWTPLKKSSNMWIVWAFIIAAVAAVAYWYWSSQKKSSSDSSSADENPSALSGGGLARAYMEAAGL